MYRLDSSPSADSINCSSLGDPRVTIRRLIKYAKQYNLTPVYDQTTYRVFGAAAEAGARDYDSLNNKEYKKEDYTENLIILSPKKIRIRRK